MSVEFRPAAKTKFVKFAPALRRAIIRVLNGNPADRVQKAASGSGFYYIDLAEFGFDLAAYLSIDKTDPELLVVHGFGPPPR